MDDKRYTWKIICIFVLSVVNIILGIYGSTEIRIFVGIPLGVGIGVLGIFEAKDRKGQKSAILIYIFSIILILLLIFKFIQYLVGF